MTAPLQWASVVRSPLATGGRDHTAAGTVQVLAVTHRLAGVGLRRRSGSKRSLALRGRYRGSPVEDHLSPTILLRYRLLFWLRNTWGTWFRGAAHPSPAGIHLIGQTSGPLGAHLRRRDAEAVVVVSGGLGRLRGETSLIPSC